MGAKDHYQVLGVERDATQDQIKKAYRRLAHKNHPDRNQGDKDKEAIFRTVADAYGVLSDPDKRARYDMGHGSDGGFSMSFNFDDVFRKIRRRGANIKTNIEVSLDDVLHGVSRQVSVVGTVQCGGCLGTGVANTGQRRQCNCCGGSGQVGNHIFKDFRFVAACQACQGTGQQADRCLSCGGEGAEPISKTMHVPVPPGILDGQTIRLRGEGHVGSGVLKGDLHVLVRVTPHPIFERKADDLWQILRLPFTTVALGGEVEVQMLDGTASLTVPAGTQDGQVFKMAGSGLPSLRGAGRGSMMVKVAIEVPVTLSDDQQKLLRMFRDADSPRPKGAPRRLHR